MGALRGRLDWVNVDAVGGWNQVIDGVWMKGWSGRADGWQWLVLGSVEGRLRCCGRTRVMVERVGSMGGWIGCVVVLAVGWNRVDDG